MKTKSIMLAILMLLVSVMVAGGTYAFLTIQANVTNTNYVGTTKCFLVDYNINNSDNTQDITGTLFPSIGPSSGLNGRVGLKTSSSCDVNGIGTLKLSVASTTASHLTEIATSHCEDKKTGDILTTYATQAACSTANQNWKEYPTNYCESNDTLSTLKNVTTASDCTASNGTWVTSASDKTPLKYAIYGSNDISASPISVGKIKTSDIGNDIIIRDNFIINDIEKKFYVYVWLDGYLTDNTHTELPFSGQLKASASQIDQEVPIEYQQVEYLSSDGYQYIDTGISPSICDGTYSVELEELHTSNSRSQYVIGVTTGTDVEHARGNLRIDGTNATFYFNISSDTSYLTNSGNLVLNNRNYISYEVDVNNKLLTLTVNGSTASRSGSFRARSIVNFKIFRLTTTQNSFIGNVYYVKIYNSGVLVRSFIPCYHRTSGIRGMYDTVNDKFYENAGDGTFGIGPDV